MNMNWIKKMAGFDCHSEQSLYEAARNKLWHHGKPLYVGILLQRAAEQFGNKTAIICGDRSISFKELYFRACLLSKSIIAAGVQPRDRVLICFENSIDFYIAYYGVLQTGAVAAPLNTFLHEKEVEHIVQDSKPALIVCGEKVAHLFMAIDEHKRPAIMTDAQIDWVTQVPEHLPAFAVKQLDPEEMALLLYTSGTTGTPKGVMLSSRNIMSNLAQGLSRLLVTEDDRLFAVLPLFHSFAQNVCVWLPMAIGVPIILVPKIDRRYILEGLRHKPTIFLGVPALYGLLCLMKTAPLSSVRCFASGGDALPDKIRAAFKLVYRRNICNGYGMTETTPILATEIDDIVRETSIVGRPLYGIECSIRDEDGKVINPKNIGVLWVKGDNIMLGYYNEPEKTAEILQDGWLCTGDLARIDDAGKIIICGREKDLIISKGLNIYPQEIENILLSHPQVIRAAVVGKIADDVGEIPVAFVEVKEQVPGLEKALRDLCIKQLAAYKVPRTIYLMNMNDMPLTATKKINKKKIRAELNEQAS